MIVVGVWESGFTDEQLFIEWRMWKQTISAYQIRDWRMVGNVPGCGAYQEFDRIEDAIADIAEHRRIFLIPGARQTVDEIRAVDNPALIFGSYDADIQFADALRRSFAKFGLKLRSEKQWDATADIRRTAASEIPIFTQDLKDHDVLIIADEVDDFGRYVPFNTWLARPVAGSQGLRPIGWDRTAEQWGAAQLQSRFAKDFDRHMYSRDYAAWAAVRSLGEAMTRTGLSDPKVIRDYILSDDFELAAFKGRALSYRSWNGQLRQPIPVVGPTAVVANAPLDGFLHQRNELDTLGLDQGESACTAFER